MRETDAHADLLFHFAKTVIAYCTFTSSSTTMLLSEYMAKCLEAYAVITYYVNSYDAWMEKAARREEEEMKIQIHLPLLAPGKEEGSLRKVKGLENSRDGTRVGSDCTTRSTECWTSKGVMNHWWSLTKN